MKIRLAEHLNTLTEQLRSFGVQGFTEPVALPPAKASESEADKPAEENK